MLEESFSTPEPNNQGKLPFVNLQLPDKLSIVYSFVLLFFFLLKYIHFLFSFGQNNLLRIITLYATVTQRSILFYSKDISQLIYYEI